MKLLFIIICCPLFTVAQNTGRQDDSLRKISDTMHFPRPFAFKMSANTNLPEAALTEGCYNWMASVKDSLKGIIIVKDSVHRIITASNVPATADITFTIVIAIKGAGYTCSLQNYIFNTINGKRLPVDKAVMIKDYKETANIEKVIVMRNYQWVFNSLNNYLEKANHLRPPN